MRLDVQFKVTEAVSRVRSAMCLRTLPEKNGLPADRHEHRGTGDFGLEFEARWFVAPAVSVDASTRPQRMHVDASTRFVEAVGLQVDPSALRSSSL